MGNYEVPVPEHWLITDHDSVAYTLMNTAPSWQRNGQFHMASIITIFPFRNRKVGLNGLDFWLSVSRQRLKDQDVKSVEEKNLNIGDDAAFCIGGTEMRDVILRNVPKAPDTDIISLECKSANDLSVLFVGEPSDLQSFYSFVSQIRKIR